MNMIRFTAPVSITAAEPDTTEPDTTEDAAAPVSGRREITGMAVPWNVTAITSAGPVQFLPGALAAEGDAPKLIRDHDMSRPIGVVTGRESTTDGMRFTARISDTADGRDALTLAADGVLDSVSVGVEPVEFTHVDGVMLVAAGHWRELSLVPFGAFAGATVETVTAAMPTPTISDIPEPVKDSPLDSNLTVPTAPLPAASPVKIDAADYISRRLTGTLTPEIRAALQDTNDSTGILPEPIISDVYDGMRALAIRRFCDAIGITAMPGSGRTFSIPKVTQRPTAALQAAEGDTLSSQALIIDPVTVTKTTVGNFVDLSEQDVDFTNPAALAITLDQMARAYARETEEIATAALITGATVTDTITDWTDADEVLTAIFTAASTIVSATGDMPDAIYCAPNRYVSLATLKSTSGDYLFPALNPSNAYGRLDAGSLVGSPAGLRLVVSPAFAAGSFVVGSSPGFRIFEQRKNSVMVDQPSTLTVRMAFRGYFATTMLDANRFVKFV